MRRIPVFKMNEKIEIFFEINVFTPCRLISRNIFEIGVEMKSLLVLKLDTQSRMTLLAKADINKEKAGGFN